LRRSILSPQRIFTLVSITVAGLVLLRLRQEGIQAYGADGAEYIEHAAKLSILEHYRSVGWTSPWEAFVGADAAFPPFLHTVTLGLGALIGHSAGPTAATGILWLFLLALSVGSSTQSITGQSRIGFAAATATVLLPAAHGFAGRYYYDLPMTALIWLSVAAYLRGRQRAPLVAGLVSGGLLAAACLTKWPALAFALPLLIGATAVSAADGTPRWGRRGLSLFVCLATAGGVLSLFLAGRGTDTSLSVMVRSGLDKSPSGSWTSNWDGPFSLVLDSLAPRVSALSWTDLSFYPLHLIVSVLSPLLSLLLFFLLLRWLKVGRVGGALLIATGLGQGLFLWGIVPVLDDRFLLVGAPTLLIAATVGWSGLAAGPRRIIAFIAIGLGLLVAADFHLESRLLWSTPVTLLEPTEDSPCSELRGIGLVSSVEHRGWSRRDEQDNRWPSEPWIDESCRRRRPPSRTQFRESVWQALSGCKTTAIGIVPEQPLIHPEGDREWLNYRGLLDRLSSDKAPLQVVDLCSEGQLEPSEERPPGVILTAVWPNEEPKLPSCSNESVQNVAHRALTSSRWVLHQRVSDPQEGIGVAIFTPQDSSPCGQ
jgi:hypothetical protein